ncbi:MAG: PIN domain-containing protein [Candidatus Eiseniibacteriota bacterium]
MSAAYLDSSFLLAIILGEPRARSMQRLLERFDDVLAGDLLVAEVLATAAREDLTLELLAPAIEAIDLVLPDRSLEPEMIEILRHGRLRGADLWHLACALYVAGDTREDLSFLSRDGSQRRLARQLGFATP